MTCTKFWMVGIFPYVLKKHTIKYKYRCRNTMRWSWNESHFLISILGRILGVRWNVRQIRRNYRYKSRVRIYALSQSYSDGSRHDQENQIGKGLHLRLFTHSSSLKEPSIIGFGDFSLTCSLCFFLRVMSTQ